MIRFFEPEGEPRWPASPAPPDLRLPPLLQFPCGSSASGMRSDAAFPMLSTSNPASHHGGGGGGGSFGKCTSPNGSSEPRTPGRTRTTSPEVERRDSFHQLEAFAPPVPTTAPLNYITGIGGALMSSEPTDPRAAVSRASSQRNAMQDTDVEREMITGSKRRKPIACIEKPWSDEPGTSEARPMQTKGRAKRSQKLGDRVTALQQLVSPFGKTDTASVLHEATVYIKALHEQIQVLTDPHHLGIRSSPALQGPGGERDGLRQKGLCLVPISQGVINLSNQAPSDRCTLERMARGPGVHLQ